MDTCAVALSAAALLFAGVPADPRGPGLSRPQSSLERPARSSRGRIEGVDELRFDRVDPRTGERTLLAHARDGLRQMALRS